MKVCLFLPAYNAAKTLAQIIDAIPNGCVDDIILVDDHSTDNTVEVAKKLGITIYRHNKNRGYGGNQKTGYSKALKIGADIVVMLHPDYQYDPQLIKYFIGLIGDGYFDVMLGSRIRSRQEALHGGMPAYKYYANRLLTFIENIVSGQNLSEWHTGMRAYSREALEKINYNTFSDDFVFDSEMLFACVEQGYRIGEISVPVRYNPDSSSINFVRSVKYGLETLGVAMRFLLRQIKLKFKYQNGK